MVFLLKLLCDELGASQDDLDDVHEKQPVTNDTPSSTLKTCD